MAAEPQSADVKVKVEKAGMMTMWQAAGTLGIGSVLVLLIVPRLLTTGEQTQAFIQEKLIGALEKSAEKSTESTLAIKGAAEDMKGVTAKVDELIDVQKEFTSRLKPLTSQLERAATAVEEQVEQVKSENQP